MLDPPQPPDKITPDQVKEEVRVRIHQLLHTASQVTAGTDLCMKKVALLQELLALNDWWIQEIRSEAVLSSHAGSQTMNPAQVLQYARIADQYLGAVEAIDLILDQALARARENFDHDSEIFQTQMRRRIKDL